MNHHDDNARSEGRASRLLKRATLQGLLFTAGSLGTTLLTLGMLADIKMPRAQGE
jgi:hypothetical protein